MGRSNKVITFEQNIFYGFGIIDSRIEAGPGEVGVDADGQQPWLLHRWGLWGAGQVRAGRRQLNNEQRENNGNQVSHDSLHVKKERDNIEDTIEYIG